MDEMARRRMALELLASEQAAAMRNPAIRRNAAPGMGSMANAGGQVPGAMGGPSGPDPNIFSQVPGGGSMDNAMPYPNPMVDDRAYYQQLGDDGFAASMAGYGTALGAMATGFPNPLTLGLALGGVGLGGIGGIAESYGKGNAKRLGFQGN